MIAQHVDLQHLNCLKCPSHAEFWVMLETLTQLPEVRAWWRQHQCRLQVIGQGSNLLCPEQVAGLTVSNALQGHWVEFEDAHHVRVRVASGEDWHRWVLFCAEQGWYGLENLALIPGSVGASPVQNIGAYGVEVSACIALVRAFNWRSGEWAEFNPAECQFAYRDSFFKQQQSADWFITDVVFELSKQFNPHLSYSPLNQLDPNGLTAQELIARVCEVRLQKLPSPNRVPNAGSFFTNPLVSVGQAEVLAESNPALPIYPVDSDRVKISAAYLIEHCGWKGWADPHSGVGTWQHHALVIVNPKQQPLTSVLKVAGQIQSDVFKRFQVELDIEPQRIDRQAIQA